MSVERLNIVILGLSITSSWGNGHATTYRGLVRELAARGHHVLFLERNAEWYAENRDLPEPPYGQTYIYESFDELRERFGAQVRAADVCIVGSYVPEGIRVGEWVLTMRATATAFYDIDTPVTMARLARNEAEYISAELIKRYDLYLSFTGGSLLRFIEQQYHSPAARALYCSVDPSLYYPERCARQWDLGYMGTYSEDRQPPLDELLIEPARQWPQGRMVVAGPQYPASIEWPRNVERITHLAPVEHRAFYNAQRYTLNITRADMIRAGYSPSVRLFEAAACGVPIISDYWEGLETIFDIEREILVARSAQDVLRYVRDTPEAKRLKIGARARARVLGAHTAAHRAMELEAYLFELLNRRQLARQQVS